MIRSFNNLVETKYKLILKMNKYNLAVTLLSRGLFIRKTFRTTINRNQIIDTTNTKRKTGNQ